MIFCQEGLPDIEFPPIKKYAANSIRLNFNDGFFSGIKDILKIIQ
jgi:hypothetical protein